MTQLTRTIRFCLSQNGAIATDAAMDNTFAAWPPMRGLGRYYELIITCRGEVDPTTGFFMNIKQIDQAARDVALPRIGRASSPSSKKGFGELMREVYEVLNPKLHESVTALELKLTPTYAVRIEATAMDQIYLSQSYEFSASHRLHSQSLSEKENEKIFGKCNNPAGHGHNYRLEVTVRCPIDDAGHVLAVEKLDSVVNENAIQKLDHKHLDSDVPDFQHINTTVENIARVVHEMLDAPIRQLGVQLDQVRLWETGKTVCTYRRPSASTD